MEFNIIPRKEYPTIIQKMINVIIFIINFKIIHVATFAVMVTVFDDCMFKDYYIYYHDSRAITMVQEIIKAYIITIIIRILLSCSNSYKDIYMKVTIVRHDIGIYKFGSIFKRLFLIPVAISIQDVIYMIYFINIANEAIIINSASNETYNTITSYHFIKAFMFMLIFNIVHSGIIQLCNTSKKKVTDEPIRLVSIGMKMSTLEYIT